MKISIIRNRRGAVLIIFAVLLIVLIGFVALAVEVGRWYTVRAELSKSVDAAALAGAKNISNHYLDTYYGAAEGDGKLRFAEDIGRQNFSDGYLMTTDTPTFSAIKLDNQTIQVTGHVNSPGNLASLFGVDLVPTSAVGVARKNKVEIMLVLDRSYSMEQAHAMDDLSRAAQSFIDFFKESQEEDKLGLVSFATSVRVDHPLSNNFYDDMWREIGNLQGIGATNAEDALSQAGGQLPNRVGTSGDEWIKQFVIFFSDGNPTAFRGKFKNNGTDNIDAVVCGTGNNCNQVYQDLGEHNRERWLGINPAYTGDGKPKPPGAGTSSCTTRFNNRYLQTTKWYVLDNADYPLTYHGTTYNSESCFIPTIDRWDNPPSVTSPLAGYICTTARKMAKKHAQELKDRNITIYSIGLGGVDKKFLEEDIASSSSHAYYTSTSAGLRPIFNEIAKEIKLRLVQ